MENLSEEQKLERIRKRVHSIKGFYKHFAIYILVNLFFLTAKWINLDKGEHFLDIGNFTMAIFWGIGVLCHAIAVFGVPAFLGSGWEERKIKQLMEKDKHNKWE